MMTTRRLSRIFRGVFACLSVILLSTLSASASSLPGYQVIGDVLFNFGPHLQPNDFGTTTLTDPQYGSLAITAVGVPSPLLTADAKIGPNQLPSIFGRGSLILNYALEIVGPSGSVPIQIEVAGGASALAGAGASFAVESRWALLDLGTPLVGDDIRSGQWTGSFDQSFSHTVQITLMANHAYGIFMLADAAAAATDQGSHAEAHAFVDPIFSFGPGVDPLSYSIVFSDGIGNSSQSAVPEPATLCLFGAGLVACLLVRRGRRSAGR